MVMVHGWTNPYNLGYCYAMNPLPINLYVLANIQCLEYIKSILII